MSIAVLCGLVTGEQLEVALACDLRLMAADAEIAVSETIAGSVPGGTAELVEHLGRGRALELCLTGRRLGAAEAFDTGLVQLVVSAAELASATEDLIVAVLAAPRDAAAETKALLAGAHIGTRGARRQAEREAAHRLVDDDGVQHPESEPGE